MTNSYSMFGGDVSYVTSISKNGRTSLFVKAAVDYYKPVDLDSDRIQSTFTLGFTF